MCARSGQRPRKPRAAWVAGLWLAALGCAVPPPPRRPASDTHRVAARPVLETARAVSLLPAETELVVAVRSTAIARRLLDLEPLWARVGGEGFGPGEIEVAGLAPHRDVGYFIADPDRRVVGLFAVVADRARLESWLLERARASGGEASLTPFAGGLSIAASEPARWVVVIREGLAFFLAYRSGARGEAMERARAIVEGDASRGLASSSRFRTLVREIDGGTEAALYVRTASLLQRELGIWDRRGDRLFGSVTGASAGIDVDGERARVRAFVAVRPDSLLDRAMVGAHGPVHPLHHASGAPPLAFSGWVRRDLIADLARGVLSLSADPVEVERRLEAKLGQDLDVGIFPALSGEVGVAWAPGAWTAFGTVAEGRAIDVTEARDDAALTARVMADCPTRGAECLVVTTGPAREATWLADRSQVTAGSPEAAPRARAAWFVSVELDRFGAAPEDSAGAPGRTLELYGRRIDDGLLFEGSYPLRR